MVASPVVPPAKIDTVAAQNIPVPISAQEAQAQLLERSVIALERCADALEASVAAQLMINDSARAREFNYSHGFAAKERLMKFLQRWT